MLFFSFLVGILFRGVAATTYFISPQGDDAAAGTSITEAWQSAKRASQVVFNAGDFVLFQGGVMHDFTVHGRAGLNVRTATGSASPSVVIGSYGNLPAQLFVDATAYDAITISDTGGIEVCNVTVSNKNFDDLGKIAFTGIHALSTSSTSGPRYSGIYIHDVSAIGFLYGIAIDAFSSCQGFSDVRIERALAMNCVRALAYHRRGVIAPRATRTQASRW
jgi:hypothetical protein